MTVATPVAVGLAVLALLAGIAILGGDDDDGGGSAARRPPAKPSASVPTIARRVERIRQLRFDRQPRPERVTPAQARREGLQDLDRDYPEERRRADEELYKLLGLLEPEVDLREVTASVFGEGVAGYYDPRTGRLRIVTGATTGNRVLNEVVIAHELTHALEDQRFDLDLDDLSSAGDRGLAHLALVEGSATALMFEYAQRHFPPDEALGGFLSSAFQDTGDLPPFLTSQLVFPYISGREFVLELFRTGNRTWRLVDAAHRFRPPASTEQIMHPDRYLRVDQPRPVRIDARSALGPGWRRATAGVFGEWQTERMLARAGGGRAAAAAGWGGDRYELWRRGDDECRAPCADRDALVLRWVWDSDRDRREFAAALAEYAGSEAPRGAATAIVEHDGAVTLALAPTSELARRLAAAPAG